ncbi:MAG: GspH/FimT family protein [Planctomycetes bacterium]|nr:GspH/FimT family protein [Planctomycetota bacterium]
MSEEPKRPRAFALLHFASFLAISTLLAAVAIPAWFGRGDVTLERAATLLARDLRTVQNHAVISGGQVYIDFLPEGDGYQAINDSGELVPLFSDGTPLARRYNADGVFQGVRVESVSLTGGGPLSYDPNGFAICGGEITLSLHEEQVVVHITEESGWIAIDGLSKPWRDLER